MSRNIMRGRKVYAYSQNSESTVRELRPEDISLPPGYRIEVFAQGLDGPNCMLFTDTGDLFVGESGFLSGIPRVLVKNGDHFDILAEDFNTAVFGINYHNGNLYVSHKGTITEIRQNGVRRDLLTGLPSNGDYANSRVDFGSDGKMYFGQGTVTNSGVVGTDNLWCRSYPFLHDYPGSYIMLNGQNFKTDNIFLSPMVKEEVSTGAYSPFSIPNIEFEVRKGITKASGSILRSNEDGTELELFAWGLRNPAYIRFDKQHRLFVSNQGYDIRGSRPVANAPDEFFIITQGNWYGWPDFTGGEPVTLNRFKPEGGPQPEFLLTDHPSIPPRPFSFFPQNTNIMGFDFNSNRDFGTIGDVYIAEFGSRGPGSLGFTIPYAGIGHRISKIDIATGGVTTFAINKSGFQAALSKEGGFGWPTDVVFGPDQAMYIVDFGTTFYNDPLRFMPNTGVIWKVTKATS